MYKNCALFCGFLTDKPVRKKICVSWLVIHLNTYQMGRMKKDSDKMKYGFLRTSQQLSSYKSNSRINQQEPWDCALVWRDKWMEGQIKMDCGKDRWVDRGERQWPWWAKLVHHVWSVLQCWWLLWHSVCNSFENRTTVYIWFTSKRVFLSQHHGQLYETALSRLLPRWRDLYLSHFYQSHISQ